MATVVTRYGSCKESWLNRSLSSMYHLILAEQQLIKTDTVYWCIPDWNNLHSRSKYSTVYMNNHVYIVADSIRLVLVLK